MMTKESLTSMVKGSYKTEPKRESRKDIDIPTEEVIEEAIEEKKSPDNIPITKLTTWFEQNCKNFDNVNQVKVAIRGIDPNKTMIIAVKDIKGGKDEEGNDRRKLRIFEDADLYPVLNLPAVAMDVYNNGFRIINKYKEGLYIKSYGVRTGLICVFCNEINGHFVPYEIKKIKKKESEITIPSSDVEKIINKIEEDADLEALQLLYKQSIKFLDELSTNNTVIEWLSSRQEEITDINHHLQIDTVLIDMLR